MCGYHTNLSLNLHFSCFFFLIFAISNEVSGTIFDLNETRLKLRQYTPNKNFVSIFWCGSSAANLSKSNFSSEIVNVDWWTDMLVPLFNYFTNIVKSIHKVVKVLALHICKTKARVFRLRCT